MPSVINQLAMLAPKLRSSNVLDVVEVASASMTTTTSIHSAIHTTMKITKSMMRAMSRFPGSAGGGPYPRYAPGGPAGTYG